MSIGKFSKTFVMIALVAFALSAVVANTYASTIFLTDNSSKTLASNEGDAAGLAGAQAGTDTTLTLSSDDGGGDIILSTTAVSEAGYLGMDADSMGNGNDKWGANQNWTFTFDQPVSFDALDFKTINEPMTLKSTAWEGDSDAIGSNWSFDGTTGEFSILGSNGPGTYDFTSAGVSDVASGTEIGFGFFQSATGGEELSSFTITVIPEPASILLMLGAMAGVGLLRRKFRG